MISSVEKIYRDTGGFCFKMILENGKVWIVPNKESNSDYQSIMEWVENGGVIVDNGA
jgi:hypothetical protein